MHDMDALMSSYKLNPIISRQMKRFYTIVSYDYAWMKKVEMNLPVTKATLPFNTFDRSAITPTLYYNTAPNTPPNHPKRQPFSYSPFRPLRHPVSTAREGLYLPPLPSPPPPSPHPSPLSHPPSSPWPPPSSPSPLSALHPSVEH